MNNVYDFLKKTMEVNEASELSTSSPDYAANEVAAMLESHKPSVGSMTLKIWNGCGSSTNQLPVTEEQAKAIQAILAPVTEELAAGQDVTVAAMPTSKAGKVDTANKPTQSTQKDVNAPKVAAMPSSKTGKPDTKNMPKQGTADANAPKLKDGGKAKMETVPDQCEQK